MTPARPKRTRQRTSARRKAPNLSPDAVEALCGVLGHQFADESLLIRAVTHPSALGPEGGDGLASNQRLEFLGDRVLGLVMAERLFERRRGEREGELAPRLNRLVSKRACAAAARHVGLGEFILMSSHEIAAGGRDRESTLGDACEAVIGALYRDGGLKAARRFVERAFAPQLQAKPQRVKDAKTLLQEWAQGEGHDLPRYRTLSREGPDHAPRFTVEVRVGEVLAAKAEANTKQAAEREAAAMLLDRVERGEA